MQENGEGEENQKPKNYNLTVRVLDTTCTGCSSGGTSTSTTEGETDEGEQHEGEVPVVQLQGKHILYR